MLQETSTSSLVFTTFPHVLGLEGVVQFSENPPNLLYTALDGSSSV